jgi:RND family efflux transporter MFP subunit
MHARSVLLASVVLVPLLTLTACGGAAEADPRTEPPLVRTVTVGGADAATRAFTGVVAARVESNLGFRVPGKVIARLVDTGATVRRGDVLMRIDPVDLQLAARAGQQAVAAAAARARQTKQDEIRYRALRDNGTVSASLYDQARAAAEAAAADLSAARAQANVARNASAYAELVADSDGVVVETLAEPGAVVVAGQPVVRLAHAGAREVVVQLPETLRPSIGSQAVATAYGQPDAPVTATLRQLSSSADPRTRTFEARYVLDGALVEAPLGTTATIRVPEPASAMVGGVDVPVAALIDVGKGPGVWIVQGEPAKVSWRGVAVQGMDDDHARVTGSLAAGDRIVALGAHLLREGEAVRVPADAAAPATAESAP